MIVHFCFKGAKLDVTWPPGASKAMRPEQPDAAIRRATTVVKPHDVVPHDRIYLAHFYDALAYVVRNDGLKKHPQIGSIDAFAELHNASLSAAVDRDNVGMYPTLMECVWRAIFDVVGVLDVAVTAESRGRLVAVCSALAWRFAIHEG